MFRSHDVLPYLHVLQRLKIMYPLSQSSRWSEPMTQFWSIGHRLKFVDPLPFILFSTWIQSTGSSTHLQFKGKTKWIADISLHSEEPQVQATAAYPLSSCYMRRVNPYLFGPHNQMIYSLQMRILCVLLELGKAYQRIQGSKKFSREEI